MPGFFYARKAGKPAQGVRQVADENQIDLENPAVKDAIAAAVEAAKVEGIVAKVVDTPLVTESLATESSGSGSHEPLQPDKSTQGHGSASLNGHGDSEVRHCAAPPIMQWM